MCVLMHEQLLQHTLLNCPSFFSDTEAAFEIKYFLISQNLDLPWTQIEFLLLTA